MLKKFLILMAFLQVFVFVSPCTISAEEKTPVGEGQQTVESRKSDFVAEGYNNQGLLYAEAKDYKLANECFMKAVNLAETSGKRNLYNNNLAMSYKDLKEYNIALETIEKVLFNVPNWESALDTKGVILLGLNRYDEAVVALTAAIKANPAIGTSYYNRGLVYEKLQKLDLAKADYKKAATLPGDFQQEAKQKLKMS